MSSEVGSGHVSIFPVMTGFKSAVTKGTRDAGAAGAKSFDSGFKGTGLKAGRQLGRDLKSALSSSTGDLGAAATKRFTSEIASASSALARVRLKQQDDAGRVRVAEARLAEAISRSGAQSSQAVAAEERLASARRTLATTSDAATAATARLKAAQAALTNAKAGVASTSGLSGLALLRRNALDAIAPVTALGRVLRTALTPAATAVKSFAGSLAATVGRAVRPVTSALSDLALRGAYKVSSALVSVSNSARSVLAPALARIAPITAVIGRSFSGIAGIAKQAFGGLASVASVVPRALSGAVSAVGRAGARMGTALADGMRGPATAGVAAVVAGIGIAAGKGFSRLTAIDTARAKLTGLGNDASSVDAIMGDALASVKGTAFGLGEAATVAAGAVAAGIKPGEQLQRTLKGVANIASASGSSMQETGAIFNKVAATGRAYTENINQLADRGIPIWQALATQLGVTTDEVRTMATEGQIDFQTFSDAAAAAAGTVAAEMGKTVPGAAKNFFAAMGRIGANALGGIYTKIAPLILAATSALGPIEERAKQFGDLLVRVLGPALDWITGLLTKIGEGASLADIGLGNLTGVLGPLAGVLVALGSGGLAGLLTKIPLLGGTLGGLAGPLAALGGPLGLVVGGFAGLALSGGDVGALVGSLVGVIDQVVAALPGMVDALIANLPTIITGAINLVMALLQGIVQAIPLLVQGAVLLVTSLLNGIVAMLPMIIQGGIQLLMSLVMGIVQALPILLQAALDLVMGLLGAIINNLPLIIDAGIQLLLSLITGLVDALPQLITAAVELVLQLVAGLLTMLPQLIQAGITLVVSLITGLIKAIPQIIEMLPQIIEAIWNGLADVDWLGLGAQIIQGIIDGFFSMVGSVGDAIGDVVGGILDFFPHSPAKKGPLSATGWRQLKTSGAATMAQFNAGAEDGAAGFGDALAGVAQSASVRAQASMAAASAVGATSSTPTSGRAAAGDAGFTQINHFEHLPVDEAMEAAGQRAASAAQRARA